LGEFEPIGFHEIYQSDRGEHLDEGVQGYRLISVATALAICTGLMANEGLAVVIDTRTNRCIGLSIAELAYGLDVYFDHLICLLNPKKPAYIEAGRI
jgi:hypothetical protein